MRRYAPRRLRGTKRDVDEISRRDIIKIWGLWTRDGARGWHKLLRARDLLLEEAESRADANGSW